MKKFLSGLVAALMLAAGLVAFSGQSAQAARACDRYAPCQATKTKATAPKSVVAGKPVTVKVSVTAAGNVKAAGKVVVTVKGPGYNKKFNGTVRNGKVNVKLGKLTKPGKYKVTVNFTPSANAPLRESKGTATITVKKKPKRR